MAVAANFVNIVAPVAGISGMAIFINETRQSGFSLGSWTQSITDNDFISGLFGI